jgi:S1-C subfamily serine protease
MCHGVSWTATAAGGIIVHAPMPHQPIPPGRIALVTLLALLAGGCALGRLWEPSREQVLQRILPSAVQVIVEQQEGRRVRTGSGVAIGSRRAGDRTTCYIVTSGHTVSKLVGQAQVYVVFDRHRGESTRSPASIVAYRDSSEMDVALLSTASDRCVPARAGEPPVLGEPVWVVGFPWGRHMTLTTGIVSQVGLNDGGDRESASRLMVDAQVSYGSSGGGVFQARDGALIGIVEGYSTARVSSQGADPPWYIDVPVPGQTFVTPVRELKHFLSRTNYAELVGPNGRARP